MIASIAALSARSPFARGALVLGAGALAVGWAVARRLTRERQPRLIDWDRVRAVATRVSGGDAFDSTERALLQERYASMVADIAEPLAEYTRSRIRLDPARVRVLDRAGWIEANIANFHELFHPLEAAYQRQVGDGDPSIPWITQANRLVLSTQVGVLLGYMARKVMGQYDISVLGANPDDTGLLYFVEPNIAALDGMLGVPPGEFRAWIALHEATHAHEFEAYAWTRGYMRERLEAYLESMADELLMATTPGALGALIGRIASNLRRGRNLIEAAMTPRQLLILAQLQSLMTLAEGYSNHVMNAVGAEILPNHAQIHERIEQRRRGRGPAELAFLRLTGLKMKMDQYALGERFADAVAAERGIDFLNLAWTQADNLPDEAEIRDWRLWVGRMDRARSTAIDVGAAG